MFSYYGAKGQIARFYPKPVCSEIREPFCGSARYACRYGLDRDVWLNDKYSVVVEVWQWIQRATRKDLLALPDLMPGDDLRDFKQLSVVERNLMGFCVGTGLAKPQFKFTCFGANRLRTSGTGTWRQSRNRLLLLVGNISHWKITCGDYAEMPDAEVTWFVDPPYRGSSGAGYPVNDVDYQMLGEWCLGRGGQVIVCEMLGAYWLPFHRLVCGGGDGNVTCKGRKYAEMLWHRCPVKVGFGL